MEGRHGLHSEQSACSPHLPSSAPAGTRDPLCGRRRWSHTQASLFCGALPQAFTVRGYMVNGFQERFIITFAPNICGQHSGLPSSPKSPDQSRSLFYTMGPAEEIGCFRT